MDERSATIVTLPFLLRGRWDNTAIEFYIVYVWMCGKVHLVEKHN